MIMKMKVTKFLLTSAGALFLLNPPLLATKDFTVSVDDKIPPRACLKVSTY